MNGLGKRRTTKRSVCIYFNRTKNVLGLLVNIMYPKKGNRHVSFNILRKHSVWVVGHIVKL